MSGAFDEILAHLDQGASRVRAGADVAAALEFLRANEPRHVPAFSRIAQQALME